MASEVTIPRLGWNMEEGTFIGWLKSDGQHVATGEPLFSLEGDKATQDVESLETGILRIPPNGPKEGDKVAVGTLIGYVVESGEPVPFEAEPARISPPAATVAQPFVGEPAHHSPPATTVAQKNAKLRMSPRARRSARELGVLVTELEGSGKTGRILERDVRSWALARAAPADPAAIAPDPAAGGPLERSRAGYRQIAVTSVRKTIAQRMVQSTSTTAAVTLSTTIDATNLVNLRQQFKAVAGAPAAPLIGFTDIIVKLTALALEKHPLLNARWSGDEILVPSNINIGIAVDTDGGLLAPVIHDVPRQTLRQIAARARDLIERAKKGTLSAADMQGGTFTVTNLGPMGIEMFTPLINLPECAILGLGRIAKQVVVEDKQFVARDRMMLSLTFDHRIVDGAPAARFLQALGVLIENPSPWLLP